MLVDYPTQSIEPITLRDGEPVTIRPIRPDDAPRLQHAFTHLSPQSIYLRFLETIKALTDEQALEMATVDYINRMALVAVIQEDGEEHLAGVGRYSMVGPQDPGTAEAAVIVRDDYQHRGLGGLLMLRLIDYARQHDVSSFVATFHMSNAAVLAMIKRSGLPFEREMLEPGVWSVRLRLN